MNWRDAWEAPRPSELGLEALERTARHARNPSSLHAAGRAAKRVLDDLTEVVCARLRAEPRHVDVIVTGGAREAMELVANQTALGLRSTPVARAMLRAGHGAHLAVVVDDRDGTVDLHAAGIAPQTEAAFAGTEPGMSEDARPVRVTDVTLALGRVDLDFPASESDVWVLSGEFSGAPPGIGALVRRRGVELRPLWGGGGQEHGIRAGTQAVALAAAWAAALRGVEERRSRLRRSAARIAEALDRPGIEILMGGGGSGADGVVVVQGDGVAALAENLASEGVHPCRAAANRLRFAVDASDSDDDIETLAAVLNTA
ncbi:MAG: aminotransferase class V-fold PLP-dependent enzyme [Myxococcota bacterium]